jgi:hypothetical protein
MFAHSLLMKQFENLPLQQGNSLHVHTVWLLCQVAKWQDAKLGILPLQVTAEHLYAV